MMIAPPAMVAMALASCAPPPPVSERMAMPRLTAPHTTTKPPRKVTQPLTRLMMFASIG